MRRVGIILDGGIFSDDPLPKNQQVLNWFGRAKNVLKMIHTIILAALLALLLGMMGSTIAQLWREMRGK